MGHCTYVNRIKLLLLNSFSPYSRYQPIQLVVTYLIASTADHANALGIDPNEYRIICRNGTLADRTGFDVEQECALTTIVDGEIVVARNNHKTTGIINALSSYDKYFQSDPDFKMFNSFAGQRDLLFRVSVCE